MALQWVDQDAERLREDVEPKSAATIGLGCKEVGIDFLRIPHNLGFTYKLLLAQTDCSRLLTLPMSMDAPFESLSSWNRKLCRLALQV